MDNDIAQLREKGLALKDEARRRWNARMANLEAKREAARITLEELGSSTGEAWVRLEKGAHAAKDDAQKAVQDASQEF